MVERYFDFYLAAMAILKDDQDAKDAVQDAVVATMVKRGVDNPYAYCCKVLRNKCMDMIRRNRRLEAFNEDQPEVDSEHEERLMKLRKLKDELPFLSRTVIELHYEEDFTIEEISKQIGVNVARVKRIVSDTKEILRKRMEEEI